MESVTDPCVIKSSTFWLFYAGMVLVGVPLVYLAIGIAYYFLEEGKDTKDSDYQVAP